MPSANEVLKRYWGFDQLRPSQAEAIKELQKGHDIITLMPTGGGKSVCFQIPALLQPGLCIVISPLVSLMQDQVESLQRKGIKAMSLTGHIPFKDLLRQLDNCLYGGYKFLYLSPERLQQELVQERIREMNINLIAIDEAHCISEWGHDFRPAYREIKILRELQPAVPFIALTATATPKVVADIRQNLELTNAKLIQMSFARNNISLLVKNAEDKSYELQKFLQKNPGVSIIYVRSRKLTLSLRDRLKHHGIKAEAYHGGMNKDQKQKLLQDWQAERFSVMVATNAFGMGIDKANVRNVVHYQLPDSLEAYYQEVGRAGRNGQESAALLLYNPSDILRLKDQFLKNAPTAESLKQVYKKLNAYFSIAYGEGLEQEFNFSFLDFCYTYNLNTYLTYNVLQFLDQQEVLRLSREFHQRTALYFKIENHELYDFLAQNQQYQNLVHVLLRLQGGFFSYKTTINLKLVQAKTSMPRSEINKQLQKLHELEVIDLTLADQDSTIEFLMPREDDYTINPLVPYIKKHYLNKKKKIESVIRFAEDQQECKVKHLLAYFGEDQKEDCKKCTVCQHKYQTKVPAKSLNLKIYEAIRELYATEQEFSSKQLIIQLDFPEENILFVLRRMLDKNLIIRTPKNTYRLAKK